MVDSIIEKRRTIKPAEMNGRQIPDEQVHQLLELADWAPTHGRTEPWRFVVYGTNKIRQFAEDHAAMYRDNMPAERYKQASFDNLQHAADGASHVVIAYMHRGSNPNIPEIEEVAATACAIQNLLLGATEHGIATFWSTGGMALQPAMKAYLDLREEDRVLAILYLGYSDRPEKEGKRSVPVSEKVKWID
jgi:nitroreductase